MYRPDHFILDDDAAIRKIIAAHPLSNLCTNGPNGPEVSHLPLVAKDEGEGLVLYGHFARANPHWKMFDGTTPALAAFIGPEGYISPSWYATKYETGKVVPTWNYVVVHARGIPEILDSDPAGRKIIDTQTAFMEQSRADPWSVDDAPDSFTSGMIRGIVAFRMVVTGLEAKAKLGQNRPAADIDGAINGLEEDENGNLAKAMREAKPD